MTSTLVELKVEDPFNYYKVALDYDDNVHTEKSFDVRRIYVSLNLMIILHLDVHTT